jgi:hypothetical protein
VLCSPFPTRQSELMIVPWRMVRARQTRSFTPALRRRCRGQVVLFTAASIVLENSGMAAITRFQFGIKGAPSGSSRKALAGEIDSTC